MKNQQLSGFFPCHVTVKLGQASIFGGQPRVCIVGQTQTLICGLCSTAEGSNVYKRVIKTEASSDLYIKLYIGTARRSNA